MVQSISTKLAPAASGPYSQAIVMDAPQRLIFVSGQLPIDPTTNQLAQEDISAMTSRTLDYIQAILDAAGSNLEKVVRVEIFCTDLKRDFASINAIYSKYFNGEVKPARQSVQVAALPLGSPIEISCIAIL